MTVPNEVPRNNYIANGSTTKFSVTFEYETPSTLKIRLNGNEPPTDKYYFDTVDSSFNFYLPPKDGDIIYIYRETPKERDIDYDDNYNSFRPKTLNKDIDRVWRVIQESFEKLDQVDADYDFVLNQVRPIGTGGTGANNIIDAQTNLDVYNKATVDALIATGGQGNIVPIEGGGTGADNAVNARGNLSVYSIQEVDSEISDAINAIPNATETTAGKAKIATTAIAQAGTNDTDFITALKLKQTLGAGRNTLSGSVNFNGTGTVSIRSQLNVSSITDLGEGTYKINMTTAMPNANYPVFTSVADRSTESRYIGIEVKAQTTNSITVNTFATGTGGAIDVDFISVGWTI